MPGRWSTGSEKTEIRPRWRCAAAAAPQANRSVTGRTPASVSDAKDPKRVADRRDRYLGVRVTILDNRGLCAHSGFCTDRLASAFHLGEEPFVTPSGARMDDLVRAVRNCPSGALSLPLASTKSATTSTRTASRPSRSLKTVPIALPEGSPRGARRLRRGPQ